MFAVSRAILVVAIYVVSSLLTAAPSAAQGKSAALLPFSVAGKADQATIDSIRDSIRQKIRSFDYSLMSDQNIQKSLGKKQVDIARLCQERDFPCYAKLADTLGVRSVFMGFVEVVGKRLAIELRHFKRITGKKEGSPGQIEKNHLEFFEPGTDQSVDDLADRMIGKILSESGFLKIVTNVQGAHVIIDGREIGTYPKKKLIPLKQGKHEVLLKHEGYLEAAGEVDVEIQETVEFTGRLKPLPFSISITSTPPNARVFLGETNIGVTPINNYQILTFGELPLKLETDRYFDHKSKIDIIPGGKKQLSINLKPQFGDLVINSDAIDVKVYLDGKFLGNTPLEVVPQVDMGKHKIVIQHNDYLPFERQIEVLPGTVNRFNLNPSPKYAFLSVVSNVERARVYVGGKFVGFSPVDDFVRMKPGRYALRITHHNYFDRVDSIVLSPGKDLTVNAQLQTRLGSLNLTSNLDGAKAYLNERYLGETPFKKPIEGIRGGEYRLILTKKPYADYEAELKIKPGRVNNHFAELVTTLGKLTVDANVKGAQILLDKKFLGKTPAEKIDKLKPGNYTLTVTKEGYQPEQRKIKIRSNETAKVSLNLQRSKASLSITSIPTGAKIALNGKLVGVTPYNGSPPSGNYTVKVGTKGYKTYETKIDLQRGKPKQIQANLTPKPYQLQVVTSERDAAVRLDGVLIGMTPIGRYKGGSFGAHIVEIKKSGFKTERRRLEFEPGKRYKLRIRLKPVRKK